MLLNLYNLTLRENLREEFERFDSKSVVRKRLFDIFFINSSRDVAQMQRGRRRIDVLIIFRSRFFEPENKKFRANLHLRIKSLDLPV